jgi:hypothetical protein
MNNTERCKLWRLAHPERSKEIRRAYIERLKAKRPPKHCICGVEIPYTKHYCDSCIIIKQKEKGKQYYKEHRQECLDRNQKWLDKHPGYDKSWQTLKKDVLSHYSTKDYPICNYPGCTETSLDELSIDHVNGGGGKHARSVCGGSTGYMFYKWLRENNYPNNPPLQVLCHSHQYIKDGHKPPKGSWHRGYKIVR